MIQFIKKELEKLRIETKTLRNFGILFFFIFSITAAYMYWQDHLYWKWILLAGIIFLWIGLISPNLLKGFYKLWMLLAFFLGWVMTRVILTVFFFIIITPYGLLLKLAGKDLLNKKIRKDHETYWIIHEPVTDKNRYKKQF